MKYVRFFLSFLLLAAISFALVAIPHANSQSLSVTTTTTVTLETAPQGQCNYLDLPFSGQSNEQFDAVVQSTDQVDFYILASADANSWLNNSTAGCSLSSYSPLSDQEGITSGQATVTLPSDGTYDIILINNSSNSSPIVTLTYPLLSTANSQQGVAGQAARSQFTQTVQATMTSIGGSTATGSGLLIGAALVAVLVLGYTLMRRRKTNAGSGIST